MAAAASSPSGCADLSRCPAKWQPADSEYTLYWNSYSQPSRAVAQLLQEGGIPYKRVDISLPKHEQKEALYVEVVNPAGLVPVLYIPEQKKFQAESADIMKFLVRKHKDKLYAWYPFDDAKTAAFIDQQLSWVGEKVRPVSTGVLRAVVVFKDSKMATEKSQQVPAALEDIENHFKQALERYQSTSEKKDRPPVVYLGGGTHPTLADLQLMHELNSPYNLGVFPIDATKQPLLNQWYQTFSERPLTKKLYTALSWPIWFASGFVKINGWFGKNTL